MDERDLLELCKETHWKALCVDKSCADVHYLDTIICMLKFQLARLESLRKNLIEDDADIYAEMKYREEDLRNGKT